MIDHDLPNRQVAHNYDRSTSTVANWRGRTDGADRSPCLHCFQITLSASQEAIEGVSHLAALGPQEETPNAAARAFKEGDIPYPPCAPDGPAPDTR